MEFGVYDFGDGVIWFEGDFDGVVVFVCCVGLLFVDFEGVCVVVKVDVFGVG